VHLHMAFVIFALPRSRTAWLSRFLTYGDWLCGHEELRHARTLDDVKAWFSQPYVGSAETAGAPWWRLLRRYAPDAKVVVIRRPVDDVVESLMNVRGLSFDRAGLHQSMWRLDRKLDQVEARVPGAVSVRYEDLVTERACAAVFEHCLPYAHDLAHWARLTDVNIQCNMPALTRYVQAYQPALAKLAAAAKQQTLRAMSARARVAPSGVTFATLTFDEWLCAAERLIDDHLVTVGESAGDWRKKNLPLMRCLHELGAMQIMTAQCNGRMVGYLMTTISPSLKSAGVTSGLSLAFYGSPDFPGIGMRIQSAAIEALRARGVDDLYFEAGKRGDGPRLGAMYRRMGAEEYGQVFRLDLESA
jgi:hypothetical protein